MITVSMTMTVTYIMIDAVCASLHLLRVWSHYFLLFDTYNAKSSSANANTIYEYCTVTYAIQHSLLHATLHTIAYTITRCYALVRYATLCYAALSHRCHYYSKPKWQVAISPCWTRHDPLVNLLKSTSPHTPVSHSFALATLPVRLKLNPSSLNSRY